MKTQREPQGPCLDGCAGSWKSKHRLLLAQQFGAKWDAVGAKGIRVPSSGHDTAHVPIEMGLLHWPSESPQLPGLTQASATCPLRGAPHLASPCRAHLHSGDALPKLFADPHRPGHCGGQRSWGRHVECTPIPGQTILRGCVFLRGCFSLGLYVEFGSVKVEETI